MSLLIAGNLVNSGYFLASKLRESGINVDLLMEKEPNFINDPLNSGEIENNQYPDWMKFFDKSKSWKRNVVRIMRKYDTIIALTEFPMFAMFSLKPYIAIATGSDLRELAQSNSIKGILLRIAFRKAKVVIFTDPDLLKAANNLKLKNTVYLPPIRNFEKIFDSILTKTENLKKFVFLHPTNHNWEQKRNDIFLKAYVKLCKEHNDVFLITINKGKDSQKSIDFLKNSNIDEKYLVLSKNLSQKEMARYYQNCDAVVDQFEVGSVGSIGLEAMFCAKPVIAYINKEIYEKLYGEVPSVLSAKTEDDVYQILKKLVQDKELGVKIGNDLAKWVRKFHSADQIIKKYIKILESIYS